MPRNISFALTTDQFRARTKTVTRRIGWENLKVGDVLMGCERCQGLKKGEKIKQLGAIRVTDVRRENLDLMLAVRAYGRNECVAEGFPDMTADQFVEMFCKSHRPCEPHWRVTRIEYEYL
jgi:hypothetical protein